jgi:hypothetical protein
MAIIYTYPTKATPITGDLILISDSADSNKTKQVTVGSLPFTNNPGTVTSVGLSMPSAFAVANTPVTNSDTIAVTTTGGNVGQFLAYDGTWGTPTGGAANPAGSIYEVQYNGNGEFAASTTFTYENRVLSLGVVGDTAASSLKIYGGGSADSRLTLFCSAGDHGVTLEGPDHTGGTPASYTIKLPNSLPSVANQILESNASGALSWIPTPSGGGGGSYTAGDGLQLNGAVFSTDLKENGGLVIESNELALDLSASSITGTLATSDGGTGSSNTEYCDLTANVTGILPVGKGGTGVSILGASRLILGNGANAVTSISSQTKGTLVVGNNTTTTTLAVGATNGHVLTIDSSEATGVRWTAATVAASDVTGTLSVSEGGTGSSADPVEIGSIMFGNANEDGYETANDFKYLNSSLTNSTSSTTLPSGYFTSNNATVVGTAGASYSASIGAVNIFNPSTVSGSVPLVVGSSYPQANINTSRLITFYGGSSGGAGSFRCGDIFSDASALSMSLSNASDYRLKENVSSIEGSTVKINALNPVNYNIIGQTTVVEGFLAHELQEQFPNAVIGDKDALDINGDINPQMVDYTKVIPALVGAIKELTARIEALEA